MEGGSRTDQDRQSESKSKKREPCKIYPIKPKKHIMDNSEDESDSEPAIEENTDNDTTFPRSKNEKKFLFSVRDYW